MITRGSYVHKPMVKLYFGFKPHAPFSTRSIVRNELMPDTHLQHLGQERQLWTKFDFRLRCPKWVPSRSLFFPILITIIDTPIQQYYAPNEKVLPHEILILYRMQVYFQRHEEMGSRTTPHRGIGDNSPPDENKTQLLPARPDCFP